MNKNENPYIDEDSLRIRNSNKAKVMASLSKWAKSRPARIAAIAAGSAVALGASFSGGVVFGQISHSDNRGPSFAEKFDRDGDHKFPGHGQHPPRPDHSSDGDRDGFGPGDDQQDPETTSPNPTTP